MEKRNRIILVLPGGGIRGAFQLGYLTKLLQYIKANPQNKISYVYGCSIGAILAPLVVTDKLDVAYHFLEVIVSDPKKVLTPWPWYYDWLPDVLKVLFLNGVYRSIDAAKLVMDNLSPGELENAQNHCSVVGLNLTQQKEEWFTGKELREGINISSCLPLAVPPIQHSNGNTYVDGGMTEVVPVSLIHKKIQEISDTDQDCDITVLVVECVPDRPNGIARSKNKSMSIIEIQDKIIGTSMNQIAYYDMARMKSELENLRNYIPNSINMMEIRPTQDIFSSALDFDKDKINQAIQMGAGRFVMDSAKITF